MEFRISVVYTDLRIYEIPILLFPELHNSPVVSIPLYILWKQITQIQRLLLFLQKYEAAPGQGILAWI